MTITLSNRRLLAVINRYRMAKPVMSIRIGVLCKYGQQCK